MRIGVLKSSKVESSDELRQKIEEVIHNFNETRTAKCWICNEMTHNWGVIFPENAGGLGLGTSDGTNGKPKTRLVFFPFCDIHDVHTKEFTDAIRAKLDIMHKELTN